MINLISISFFNMTHEYGTRSKLQVDPALKIVTSIKSFQDEITNLKDIIIKKLQEDNERLRTRWSNLQNTLVSLEMLANALEQYGRRNNLVWSGIPDTIPHDELESTIISVLADADVKVESTDIENCQ